MKGISIQALNWAIEELIKWSKNNEVGPRAKQVIYRLLLLRELGVSEKGSNSLSTSDFRNHCRKYLLISSGSDIAQTGNEEYYFNPNTCTFQKATPSSDWAIGTMWTRCQTWESNHIISISNPEKSKSQRIITFQKGFEKELIKQLNNVKLPALPLAIFLFRSAANFALSLDGVNNSKELMDEFKRVFKLDDKKVLSLFDLSMEYPGPLTSDSSLTNSQILNSILEHVPFEIPPQEHGEEELLSKYIIPESKKKGESAHPVQILVHGCPGSGKSYLLQQWAKEISMSITVVFHPETTYADFVGVYRPKPVFRSVQEDIEFTDETGLLKLRGEPYITYAFSPGPLLEAYCFAKKNPKESVVLVIEELSRGNASLIFGDMLQLLDRHKTDNDEGKAGESVYEIMPKSEISTYIMLNGIDVERGGRMRFPSNLHIWATMNRSDQNARQLDAAFLRRWDKHYLSYMKKSSYGETLLDVPGGKVTWDDFRQKVNNALIGLVSEDKFIGPYFLSAEYIGNREKIAEDLLGYLWNDVLKTRATDFFIPNTFSELREMWLQMKENPFKAIKF